MSETKRLWKRFDYSKVSLKKIQKDKYILSSDIEGMISRNELNVKARNALTTNGRVYFLSRKKEVCGVVIIRYEKHMASDFNFDDKDGEEQETKQQADNLESLIMDKAVEFEEKSQIGTKKGKQKENEKAVTANAYVLEALYLDEELKLKEKDIMHDLVEELKEAAAFNDLGVKVIIWGDNIIFDKTVGKTGSSAITIGMCLGMMAGMMFGVLISSNDGDSSYISLGVLFGMSIGMSLGTAYYGISKTKISNRQEDINLKFQIGKGEE